MRNKANLGIHVSCLNVVVIIVSLFSSCAGETNIIDGNNNKLLSFSVSVPSWKSNDSISSSKDSRATPITETSLGTSNTFNLIADENDGSGNYSTLIDNKPVSYSNNLWKTTTDYYWSGTSSKTINFYAYYSTSAINGILNHTAGSAPTLTYTVPDDAANQHDIIVATKSLTEDANSAVDLSFNHIFAAVKFSVGTSGLPSGTIASISISGINNSGTYTFGSGWSNITGSKTFTISPSIAITGTSGTSITSGTYTLMMIPQTFTNVIITVTYSTGTAYTKTISGTWAAGNTYTYNLSKSVNVGDYYFSDGTWGTIAEHTNSTAKPIALIFSNSTSTTDKGYGWTHGYAIALKDAYEGTLNWSSSSYGTTLEMGKAYTDINSIENDLDGYTHTKTILAKSSNILNDYPPFYYAYNFKNTVTPPSNSSGWYLASAGQYHQLSIGPCKISTSTFTLVQNTIGWVWTRIDGGSLNSSFVARDNLNSYLNAAANVGASVTTVLCGNTYSPNWIDSWLYSSSEYTASLFIELLFGANGDLMYDHRRSKNDTASNIRSNIRPVIAF